MSEEAEEASPSSMPHTASAAKKHGADQSDAQKAQQRLKMGRLADDGEKKVAAKRLKDIEITIPIVYGTISFWLGKKASEYQSHKWTVYVRGATSEDLSAIIKRVVFQLHPSFNNPTRVVESAPFELSESGWGEFEIAITLFFHGDVCDKQLDLYHHLKLYPEDESGPQSTKKPVVVESYDEIVFSEPSEAFYSRIQNHPSAIVPRLPPGISLPPPVPIENSSDKKRGDSKDHQLSQWFMNFSEADELSKLAAARQQSLGTWHDLAIFDAEGKVEVLKLPFGNVQAHIVKLRRQLSLVDGQPQQLKLTSASGLSETRDERKWFCRHPLFADDIRS
ncbi:Transcription initiation factor TFIID subunit 14b [Asimina triloba]